MSDLMWMISNNLINVVDVLFSVLIPWIMVETKRKKIYAVAASLILFVLLGICNVFVIGSIANAVFCLCVYLVVLLAIREKYLKVAIWVTVALVAQTVIDVIMVSIQTAISQDPNYLG